MKKYVAFLRGINISGKNKIDMSSLKKEFERLGFSEVTTYLNSGNIVFQTDTKDSQKLTEKKLLIQKQIEKMIVEKYGFEVPVYVIDMESLNDILAHSPEWWNTGDKDQYDNLIFILTSDTPEQIAESVGEPTEGLEQIEIYRNVIFWTFDRVKYQKCNWWKRTASAGIAQKLTIRTASTVMRLV